MFIVNVVVNIIIMIVTILFIDEILNETERSYKLVIKENGEVIEEIDQEHWDKFRANAITLVGVTYGIFICIFGLIGYYFWVVVKDWANFINDSNEK